MLNESESRQRDFLSGKPAEVAAFGSTQNSGTLAFQQSPADAWNPCRKQVKALELAVTRLLGSSGLASTVLGWGSAGSHLGGSCEYDLGRKALTGSLLAHSKKEAALELGSSEQSYVALLRRLMQRSTKLHLSPGKRTMRLTSDATICAFGGRYTAALSSDLADSTSLQMSIRHGSRSQERSRPGTLDKRRPDTGGSREDSRIETRDAGGRNRLTARVGGMPHRSRMRKGPRRISSYSCIASELTPAYRNLLGERNLHRQEALQHRVESGNYQARAASQCSSMGDNIGQEASSGAPNIFKEQLPWWQEVLQEGLSIRARFSGQVSRRCSMSFGGKDGLAPPLPLPLHGHLHRKVLKFPQSAVHATNSPALRWRSEKAHEKSYAHRNFESQSGARNGAAGRSGAEIMLEAPLGPHSRLRWSADACRELGSKCMVCLSASTAGKQQEQRKWRAQVMSPAWRGKLLSWHLQREQDGKRTASVRLMCSRRSNPKWNVTVLCSKHKGLQMMGKMGPAVESAVLRNASLVDRLAGKVSVKVQQSWQARMDFAMSLPI